MNPILASIAAGYTAEEILNFISKAFSGLSPKIAEASGQGYSPNEILNFLQNFNKKDLKKFKAKKNQASQAAFEYPKEERGTDLEEAFDNWYGPTAKEKQTSRLSNTLGQPDDTFKNVLSTLTKAGTAAGGAYLLNKALPKVAPFIQSILGEGENQEAAESQTYNPPSTQESQSTPVPNQTLPPQIPQIINQNPVVEAAKSRETNQSMPVTQIDAANILNQMGLKDKIDNLAQIGNGPEQISAVLDLITTPSQKNWLKQQTPEPIESLVNRYLSMPNQMEKSVEETISEIPIKEEIKTQEDPSIEEEVKKDKLAILPEGIVGEVESIKDGVATLKVNGKKRRLKVEDLQSEPTELEPIVDSLIKAIPEDQRSAVLAFANYSPNFSFDHGGQKFDIPMMAIQFHSGDLYLYPGVTKDQYDRIVDKATPAKTTGSNVMHAWTQGKESRGAGFYQIKKELEESFGKNFIKFKASEGYDFWKTVRETIKQIETRKKRSNKSN